MSEKRIAKQRHATFESIRLVDANGNDFWLARPLSKVLDYSECRHFLPVVERARSGAESVPWAWRPSYRSPGFIPFIPFIQARKLPRAASIAAR